MALYNQGFPIGYNPNQFYNPQPSQFTQPVQQPVQQQQYMTWVQGEAAAKAYLVSPGTTIPLWDSESPTIYLKSADASGKPSMRVLKYTIVTEQPVLPSTNTEYLTADNIGKYIEQYLEARKETPNESENRPVPNVTHSATTIEPPWAADKSV